MSNMNVKNGFNAASYNDNAQTELIKKAYETLENFLADLGLAAGWPLDKTKDLWRRVSSSDGLIRELAYYHDYGKFLCECRIGGYSLTDILVWQVDHFKAYMDRHDDMNRYRPERLFLESFDIMSKMEHEPSKYICKMQGETGTDFVDKYH